LTAGIAIGGRRFQEVDWEDFVLRDPDSLVQAQPEEVSGAVVADGVLRIAITKIDRSSH
jgi:hypothetical protein